MTGLCFFFFSSSFVALFGVHVTEHNTFRKPSVILLQFTLGVETYMRNYTLNECYAFTAAS